MYEHRSEPLLPRAKFARRLAAHALAAGGVVSVSLLIGTVGYHSFGHEGWVDAFLNAAMLLGGMGQVGEVTGNSGKLFAALFALYSGLVLIAVTTLLFTPVLHRILHRVHLDNPDSDREAGD